MFFYESTLHAMLVLAVVTQVKGEITPNAYTTPDGTRLSFGYVSSFSVGGFRHVTDIQVDAHIPGNLLAVDFATLRTVNESSAVAIVGNGIFTGYRNGYGTEAFVSYPAVYQLTSEILLLAEYYNHCVRLLNRTDNNSVTDFVGSCQNSGYADGVGTAARFERPTRLLGHPDDPNLVFVAEEIGNIRLINMTTRSVSTYLLSAFTSLTSIGWDPYYCNTLLITDYNSFKRLQIDTFTLTTYDNASEYVNRSTYLAQYEFLYDATVIYKDIYVVADHTSNRLHIIDTAGCTAFSGCSGVNSTADGPLDQCSLGQPSSLLYYSGTLYIGGSDYIKALPVNLNLSGSSATMTPTSSCAPIPTGSTRNESAFIDEAPCQQQPFTANSTTSSAFTTSMHQTSPSTLSSESNAATVSPSSTSSKAAGSTSFSLTENVTKETTVQTGSMNRTSPTEAVMNNSGGHIATPNGAQKPFSDTSTATGYTCANGTAAYSDSKTCPEGCFGLYTNGESKVGCLEDLHLLHFGFEGTNVCGTNEQNGKCVIFVTEHGGDDVNCIRCCKSGDNCNIAYKDKCDYVPTDDKCSSCVLHINNTLLSFLTFMIFFYNRNI